MGSDERLQQIKDNVKAEFEKKRESERKAIAVVHRMLETPSVDEQYFKECINLINPDYYHDITVERSIASLCGYPLCPLEIETKTSSQKYHISTKTNTVFDVSDRENFCSIHCYKASIFYAKQIPSDPLWTRKDGDVVSVTLLRSEDAKDDLDGFVKVSPHWNPTDERRENIEKDGAKDSPFQRLVGDAKTEAIKFLLFDQEQELAKKIESVALTEDDGQRLDDRQTSSTGQTVVDDQSTRTASTPNPGQKSNDCQIETQKKIDVSSDTINAKKSSSVKKVTFSDESPSKNRQKPDSHVLDPIWNSLRSWVTRATVHRLWSERLGLEPATEPDLGGDRFDRAVRKIDVEERRAENRVDDQNGDASRGRRRPLPDYERLKEDELVNSEKVKEFFKGSFMIPCEVAVVEEKKKNEKDETIPLPLTDRHSQMAIRRNLVMDRLLIAIPDVCASLNLTVDDVVDELRGLVDTFHLDSHTIVLRPGQWAVVAVLLLKMASIRDERIWREIHSKKSVAVLGSALDEIGVKLVDADNIVALLTDPRQIGGALPHSA